MSKIALGAGAIPSSFKSALKRGYERSSYTNYDRCGKLLSLSHKKRYSADLF